MFELCHVFEVFIIYLFIMILSVVLASDRFSVFALQFLYFGL